MINPTKICAEKSSPTEILVKIQGLHRADIESAPTEFRRLQPIYEAKII